MARPLRIEYPGAVYHITARGNGRQAIFHDDRDYLKFLEIFVKTQERYNWLCHAYCLMGNHYHLMIETPEANISKGMPRLNAAFSRAHHKRHETVGHLFQGRFKGIVVDRESYLLELARYVVLNPVRAGLVARPEDWPWSSYRATVGLPPLMPTTLQDAIGGALEGARQGAASDMGTRKAALPAERAETEQKTESTSSTSMTMSAPAQEAQKRQKMQSPRPVQSPQSPPPPQPVQSPQLPRPVQSLQSPPPVQKTVSSSPSASPAAPAAAVIPVSTWLLGQFGPDLATARQRYCEFVVAGIGRESPWRKLKSQLFLGNDQFVEDLKATIPAKKDIREIPKPQRFAGRPSLGEIFGLADALPPDGAVGSAIAARAGGARRREAWRDKHKRDEAIYTSNIAHGYDQKEIADFLGIHYTTVSRAVVRHENRLERAKSRKR